MSTGQIVGGVVGAVIGAFFENPFLGAQLGMMAGGYLDPPKGPTVNGPRLNDLTVQTSTYGAFIPRIYGTDSLYGNVFWLEGNKIKEVITKKKTGGKGGSKTTTKTPAYFATFAVGLADRPAAPITGVRRIWIKGDLFYDAGSNDPATIMSSNEAAATFKIYLGSNTQEPDPRIQSDVGVDNAPAYRGLAYIVFYDLPLANYANSLMGAQVKVEVVTDGDIHDMDVMTSIGENTGLCSNLVFDGFKWVMLVSGQNKDVLWTEANVVWNKNTGTAYNGYYLQYRDGMYVAFIGTGYLGSVSEFAYSTDLSKWFSSPHPGTISDGPFVAGPGDTYLLTTGTHWCLATATSTGFNYISGTAADTIPIVPYNEFIYPYGITVPLEGNGAWNGHYFVTTCKDKFRVGTPLAFTDMDWRTSALPSGMSYCLDVIAVGESFYALCVDASLLPYLVVSEDDARTWSVLGPIYIGLQGIYTRLSHNGSVFCLVDFVLPIFVTSVDGVTWEYRSLVNVHFGEVGVNLRRVGAPVWGNSVWAVKDDHESVVTFGPTRIDSNYPSLGEIVAEEVGYAGLSGGDIDVSSLTSEVRGYLIGSAGSARAALEPLRVAWPFDVIQHGYKTVFKVRGGVSVATIDANDLDAHSANAKPGVQITVNREMDSQMPRKLTIKHADFDREYDTGEQYAERLNVTALNDISHELPIVMTSAEAAARAEVLLYLAWLERYDLAFNLPATYNQLEPADVIMLPTVESTLRLRLVTVNYSSDGRVECKAKYDRVAVYTPAALGASPKVTGPSTLPRSGPSEVVMLDVPMMHTAQADPSFLTAMYGPFDGWQSGTLVRTDDAGTTWVELASLVSPGSTVGNTTNSLGVVDSRVWDKVSRLGVHLLSGDLYDTTEAGVMNGTNHFAYGYPGRWEIIAAQKCALGINNNYVLSDFLRGRFGTEWAMGLHSDGDTVVLLDTEDIAAIGMSVSNIGIEKTYRAITQGQAIETGADKKFTYVGVNLECLSPISLSGDRAPSGDWTFKWIRRSRTDWEWRDNVDVSLGETVEAYEVDIFADNTYTTVKRTVTASTPTCGYTNAQQVTDFGAVQGDVFWEVYQLSSVVGRGYPARGFSTTRHYLIADRCVQTAESPIATMAPFFNATLTTQHALSASVAITMSQTLVGTSASQANACSTGAITISHNVIAATSVQVNNGSAGAITQVQNMVGTNCSQGNESPGYILGSPNDDPYWGFVKLLILMDTTTADDKKGHSVTNVNSAALETTGAPFSGGHILVLPNGIDAQLYDSGKQFLEVTASSDFLLGSDPFCIEFFFKTDGASSGDFQGIVDFLPGDYEAQRGYMVTLDYGQLGVRAKSYYSDYVVLSNETYDDDVLHHAAITGDGSICRIWVDGDEATYSEQVTGYDAMTDQGPSLFIGGAALSYLFNGKIGPVRITVGHQRYTTSFTPPTDYPYS